MVRRRSEEWGELIKEQLSSGKTQTDFCGERGVSMASFQWWKKRLKRESAPFVEVTVPEDSEESWKAELELPGGVIFRMSW